MTNATSNPVPPNPVNPSWSRPGLLLGLLMVGVGVAGGVGWYVWKSKGRLEPPAVDGAGADPEAIAAIEAARDEVRRSPRSAAAWGRLGKILAAHGYQEPAGSCFSEAERLQPDEDRWPYFHGLTLMYHDGDAAVAQFQHAVRLHGDAPAMRLRLADALLAQGDLDGAAEQYRWLVDAPALAPRAELALARPACHPGQRTTHRSCPGRRPTPARAS